MKKNKNKNKKGICYTRKKMAELKKQKSGKRKSLRLEHGPEISSHGIAQPHCLAILKAVDRDRSLDT